MRGKAVAHDFKNGKHDVFVKNANDEDLCVAEIIVKIRSRSANPIVVAKAKKT